MALNLFRKSPIKSYWWIGKPNFGDALSPYLLEHFAYLKVEWSPIGEATIASIGSILEHIPEDWRGYILGSGILREGSRLKFDRFNRFETKILALRGPLSARGIFGDFAIGDPGLLANELVQQQDKRWDLGIIPHWKDDVLAQRFRALVPAKFSCKVITASDDPLEVVRTISACKRVVTSSLHGMIIADSFAIPRRFEYCSNLDKEGGLFKFLDYSASIQTPLEIGKMQEPMRKRVDDVKFAIFEAYRELSRVHGKGC